MASRVYKFILQLLCDNQGSLDFQSLNRIISQHYSVEEDIMRTILFDDGRIAIQEGKQKNSGGVISPDSIVVAKTSLRVCPNKTCQGCDKLHLCKYYVWGDCTFKEKCKYSHSVSSPHNATILEKSGLQGLTEKQLFQLLLQNDPYLLPEICFHYNKGAGESGSCAFASSCTKLHMCLHFLQGDCTFGPKCKRAHSIDAQGMKLLKQYSRENFSGLFKIYRNKLIILGHKAQPASVLPAVNPAPLSPSKQLPERSPAPPKAVGETDRNEICLFFIRRHCSFKEACVRVHWHLPYKWEMWEGESMTWKNMNNMEEIEKAYCNPANDTSCTDEPTAPSGILRFLSLQISSAPSVQSVDFIKMMYGTSAVRRLSTASSVSNPPHYILTTEWLWYWKDDTGAWVEYGKVWSRSISIARKGLFFFFFFQDGTGGTSASLSSQTLENLYLADRQLETEFTAGNHKYKLSFKGGQGLQMYQQNTKYHTIREVRRRPRFVSAHDVEAKLVSSASQSTSSSPTDTVPSNWNKNALPEIGYKLVPLSTSSNEYTMIEKLFKTTMPQSRITSIQRIQNPSMWRIFQWQKEQMRKRNDDKPVNEKHLFHGTDKSLIEAICDQNFDWRMCGVHGTAYGKGSYFARDASYSNRYASGHQSKVMFVALVLVGEFTRGRSSYVRPPPKGNGRTLYDSCVDSEADPGIFVIFEKQQIYPEYLIEYI